MLPLPVAGAQEEPAVAAQAHSTLAKAAGKASVTVAPTTVSGPALAMVNV